MSATWSPPSLLGQHLPSLPPGITGAVAQAEQGAAQGHVAAQQVLWFSMNSTCSPASRVTPQARCSTGRGHHCQWKAAGPVPKQSIPNRFYLVLVWENVQSPGDTSHRLQTSPDFSLSCRKTSLEPRCMTIQLWFGPFQCQGPYYLTRQPTSLLDTFI